MVDEFSQAQVLGEGGRQEQAGIGHQAVVVKEDADTVGIVLWQHLLGAPCFRAGFCSKTIIPDSEEHPLASSRAVPKAVLRWIRVKLCEHESRVTDARISSAILTLGSNMSLATPGFPISSCLDSSDAPDSTRAMVVSLTNAVNQPSNHLSAS